MAFVKSNVEEYTRTFRTFLDAKDAFENNDEIEEVRFDALNYILGHQEISYVLDILLSKYSNQDNLDHPLIDHPLIDHAFSSFTTKPKRAEDYDNIFKMLQSSNAYLRNKAITFLQEYGETAKPFISKLLHNEDKDIRIFAVNILGDVNYEDSRDMLLELIEDEKNINVIMTAVDYLGEIGELEDIEELLLLKEKFSQEPYVAFGIDLACEKIKG
ncbi:MAG: HEAT repeat domain-containing protein [Campylobacterota bacterium]|nr:HEAT repeat domain-containing protein [Campylobacterota bacterium]